MNRREETLTRLNALNADLGCLDLELIDVLGKSALRVMRWNGIGFQLWRFCVWVRDL